MNMIYVHDIIKRRAKITSMNYAHGIIKRSESAGSMLT